MNNKEKIVLLGILVVVLVLAFYVLFTLFFENKNQNMNKIQNNIFQTIIDNQNNVEFQVTPLNSSEFEISINTHSVDLDFDLKEISKLYDDVGNVYEPLKWDGSEPGGHHREGVLKFTSINKNAKSIKLVINDGIGRVFNWNIK